MLKEHFEWIRVMGEGSFGQVYLIRDKTTSISSTIEKPNTHWNNIAGTSYRKLASIKVWSGLSTSCSTWSTKILSGALTISYLLATKLLFILFSNLAKKAVLILSVNTSEIKNWKLSSNLFSLILPRLSPTSNLSELHIEISKYQPHYTALQYHLYILRSSQINRLRLSSLLWR